MSKIAVSTLFILLLCGCGDSMLPFGADIDKTGSEIGKAEFDVIESRLTITLPAGTIGVEYRYRSGIDDSLRAKFFIPKEKLQEAEAIIQQLTDDGAMASPHDWGEWLDTDSANIIFERTGVWSEFNYGNAALTEEGGKHFLYLHWFTM